MVMVGIRGLKNFYFIIAIGFFKKSMDMCYFYKKIIGPFLKLVCEGKERGHMSMITF